MVVSIQHYEGGRDEAIADLVLSIQVGEAGLDLTIADQPDLSDIPAAYSSGGFWIAVDDRDAIGTIGLLTMDGKGVLKKFFVAASRRSR